MVHLSQSEPSCFWNDAPGPEGGEEADEGEGEEGGRDAHHQAQVWHHLQFDENENQSIDNKEAKECQLKIPGGKFHLGYNEELERYKTGGHGVEGRSEIHWV